MSTYTIIPAKDLTQDMIDVSLNTVDSIRYTVDKELAILKFGEAFPKSVAGYKKYSPAEILVELKKPEWIGDVVHHYKDIPLKTLAVSFTAAANTTTTQSQIVTTSCYISRIDLQTSGALLGDQVSISFVDVDNVLGKGENHVLSSTLSNIYVDPKAPLSFSFDKPIATLPKANLYVRIAYKSTQPSTTTNVYINIYHHD